eukprot:353830-Chlamydomonas_euryale.AAC.10
MVPHTDLEVPDERAVGAHRDVHDVLCRAHAERSAPGRALPPRNHVRLPKRADAHAAQRAVSLHHGGHIHDRCTALRVDRGLPQRAERCAKAVEARSAGDRKAVDDVSLGQQQRAHARCLSVIARGRPKQVCCKRSGARHEWRSHRAATVRRVTRACAPRRHARQVRGGGASVVRRPGGRLLLSRSSFDDISKGVLNGVINGVQRGQVPKTQQQHKQRATLAGATVVPACPGAGSSSRTHPAQC